MDLASRLKNFFANRAHGAVQAVEQAPQAALNFGGNLIKNAGGAIGNAISQPFQQAGFNQQQGIQNTNPLQNVAAGIGRAQNFVESPQSFKPIPTVTPFRGNNVLSNIGNFGANLPGDLINGVVAPTANFSMDVGSSIGRAISGRPQQDYTQLKSPFTRLIANGMGDHATPSEVLGNIGGATSDVLSTYTPNIFKGIGEDALKYGLARRSLITALKPQIYEGALTQGVAGLGQGLNEGRGDSLPSQLLKGAAGGAEGLTTGGLLAGGVGTAGFLGGKTKLKAFNFFKNQGFSDKEAEAKATTALRDELGRFIGREPVNEPTPPGLMNNMLAKNEPVTPLKREPWQVGGKYGKEYTNITPEMRMAFRKHMGIPENIDLPSPGLSIKSVDSKKLLNEKAGWTEFTPYEQIPIGSEVKMENGKQYYRPYNEPQSVGNIMDNRTTPPGSTLPDGAGDVSNPKNPFYNVKRVGIEPDKQMQLKTTVENSAPEIKAVVGDTPLTHQNVIDEAQKIPDVLKKTMTKEDTLALGAQALNLRNQVAQMAKEGKVTPEFIDALTKDKAMGENLARLLGQRSIVSDPAEKPVMQQVLQEVMKKNQNTDEILKAAEGVNFNDANQAAKFYRDFVKPRAKDYIDLLRYNSMLSSPNTHINNAASNLLNTSVVAPLEKTITGTIDFLSSKVRGKEQTQFASEGGAYLKGYYSNLGNAAHAFADTVKGNLNSSNLDLRTLSPLHGTRQDTFLSMPMRLLEASDQFFTKLTEGGEKAALNLKEGKGVKVGNLDIKASDNAAYRLYRSELHDKRQGTMLNSIDDLTSKIQALRMSDNPVTSNIAKFTLPFVRTPMNIFKQMIEYSPAGVATIPGAANKTEQLSKAILGTAGMVGAMTLVTSGRTTWAEPTDPTKKAAFRAAGLQPYAVKVGDKWISYSKLPPAMAIPLAITSALYDGQQNKTLDQGQIDAILSGVAKVGNFFSDQSYLKNIGDAISSTKGNPENMASFIGNYPQQLIPYRALMGWMARLVDPYQRKVDTSAPILSQQIQQLLTQIPLASGAVPARVDKLGNPIPNQNKELNAFSPFKVTTERPDAKANYDLLQQKTMLNKNLKAATNMMMKGQTPDFSALQQASAAEITPTPQQQAQKPKLDLKTQLQDKITKAKVKQTGQSQTDSQGNLIVQNNKGNAVTIDLNPPTKGQGIDAFANQNWNVNKAREVYSADIPQAQKDAAYKKLGVDPAKMEYEYKASKSNDVKTQYATSQAQSLTHDQLIQRLQTGRVDSLSGTKFADNTVLDNLAKNGLISFAEAASLKKIDLNSDGQPKVTNSGKGRKGAKVDFRQFTKIANIKAPRVSIVRHASKAFKAPTIKAPVVDHPTFKQLTFKGKPLTLKKK